MPEVHFQVRWPDGAEQRCTSPSRAIEKFLVAGGLYPVAEFVRRSREGLDAAADRVQERFGFRCTAAVEQIAAIEAGEREHGGDGEGTVAVERLAQAPSRPRFPAPDRIDGEHEVVIVGGGQAGLAASACLAERGVEHLVLEADRIAHNWSDSRWDSFCLVTPNWQCGLPGFPYSGEDPTGFMVKDEIISYIDAFAAATQPPLYEGVAVERVSAADEGYRVATSRGELTARTVILAVGGYHQPRIPALGRSLPDRLTQLHSSGYRNPESLPDGAVLVVGTGQSGAQIAEDLQIAGRQVHLCVGSAPRVARFYRGRDCVAWLQDMGHYDMPIDDHPEGFDARHEPNHYVTGRDGGRDIDLRAHALDGMRLHGRLLGCEDGQLRFGDDLADNLDGADATAERIKDRIDDWISEQGIDAPTEPRYSAPWAPEPGPEPPLDSAEIAAVVWATGFEEDWSWVEPPVFADDGAPDHERGVTDVPGLYFLGLPWLHTWGSGRFAAIARDAAFVADDVASKLAAPAPVSDETKPPLPPFSAETAAQKVQAAEDAWNTRDPEKVSLAYTPDSVWRNRDQFLAGREEIVAFLTAKWERELDYALRKNLWAFDGNRIAVRFQYECRDSGGAWWRAYGNELWEFAESGLMRRREASINDLAIGKDERRIFGPREESEAGVDFPLR